MRICRYIDDYINVILIGTKTFEEHISVMTKIFQKLIDYNFTLN